VLTAGELIKYFAAWVKKFPVWSLEDGLAEDDWRGWTELMGRLGDKVKIIGDDLTVTDPERLQRAIDLKAINAILIKLNQIGSVSETLATIKLAHKHNIETIISHRGGGETNDTFMIDLAVAVNAAFVRSAPRAASGWRSIIG
jgi:enolase